jgi:hypothetical protein
MMTDAIAKYLTNNCFGQDVHLVQVKDERDVHLGYYFWEGGKKVHELQLIRDMRLVIGLDPTDIRQMLAEAKLIKVSIEDETVTTRL